MVLRKINKDVGEYNSFCSKLLKNLGLYSENAEFYIRSNDRCNILYNWVYNSKEKHAIPDQIINDCFEEYFKIGNAMKYKYKCYYDIYNSLYEDPINITLFDIFNDKMSIIETALVNEDASTNTNGRNFVCACVKKYKEMNDAYCLPGKRKSKDYTNTCKKLREFKDSYTWYLYNKHNLRDMIPSLDNIDQDLLAKCPKQQERSQLYSGARGTPVSSLGNGLPTGTVGQSHLLADDTNITPGNVDNPMKKTITTTIGTFAGASSLLAFLYKVNTKFYLNICIILHTYYYSMF
ncbi:hypothetical protein PVBG_05223 [Plasmodium vivax Brazil I]|uniref:VIR protein n=1 Tax=Plasmodium vivax (strain Brazil I) TaxID=1033975 RepID=A0A0J9VAX1_PLAV1|nr:hypothetical protein PVBG_05223 [Plasmodium vivax Brazil I]